MEVPRIQWVNWVENCTHLFDLENSTYNIQHFKTLRNDEISIEDIMTFCDNVYEFSGISSYLPLNSYNNVLENVRFLLCFIDCGIIAGDLDLDDDLDSVWSGKIFEVSGPE